MTTKHRDITDEVEIHVPKGFTEAPLNHGLVKNAAGELEWVPISSLGGAEGPPGSIARVPVADINDPATELALVGLPTEGRILYAVQVDPSIDAATFYYYDDNNTTPVNSPYILATLDGGDSRWVAIEGKYKLQGATVLDGSRYISQAEITKLAGIDAGATGDQTGSEIKALYEAEADTNAFTDAEKSKLSALVAGGEPNQTDAQIKVQYENNANTNAYTDAEKSKLANIEASATADQTPAEIETAYESQANTNKYTDAEKSKLGAIEAGATADQTGAEIKALYEAEADTNAFTDAEKATLAGLSASAGEPNQSDAEIKIQYENNANTNAFTDAEQTKLAGIEAGATADQTGAEIKALYEAQVDTNPFTDALESKLSSIETGAQVNPTPAETKVAYEANTNTNVFTDANLSKLNDIEANADVTDSVNVEAAGAVMYDSTDVSTADFVIDEDDMLSDSNTKVPTQQSVRAYVNSKLSSTVEYKGGYNATANIPDLDTAPSGILKGHMYTVTLAGDFFGQALEIGDLLIAEQDDPTSLGDWTVVNKDLNAGSIKTSYESNSDTNAFTDSEKSKLAGIESGATADQSASEIEILYEGIADTNKYTDAEKTKLAGVESGATSDQTGSEIKALYEAEANTNAFTDTEKAKLADTEVTSQLDARDTANRARANHTGTQLSSTISDLKQYLDDYHDRSSYENSAITTTTSGTFQSRVLINKTPLNTAKYLIRADFKYSYDSIESDIEIRLLVNGTEADRILHEPQDSGGFEGVSGTNQRFPGTFSALFDATASTAFSVELEYRSAGGSIASIKDHKITIERFEP